jgi:glutaconate CoA-transferase subunit A
LKEYNASAKAEDGFAGYFEKYINGKTEQEYQQLVGGLAVIQALPQTVY